jgi:hypothetical protein
MKCDKLIYSAASEKTYPFSATVRKIPTQVFVGAAIFEQ